MSEAQAPTEAPKVTEESRDYYGVLKSLVGKQVTIVNPESYEAAPMVGFQLKEGYYKGKVTGMGQDYLIFQTIVTLGKKEGGQQPVQQFLPIDRIKRLSVMKTNILLHI